MSNVSETPTPTTCLKSTAAHLQFVRQYAPHLYRRAFLASKLRRKGNPAIRLPFCTAVRLPFVRQYAPHLYGSTFGKILGVGVTGTFWGKSTILCIVNLLSHSDLLSQPLARTSFSLVSRLPPETLELLAKDVCPKVSNRHLTQENPGLTKDCSHCKFQDMRFTDQQKQFPH